VSQGKAFFISFASLGLFLMHMEFRYAVISDVHANVEALGTVLEDIKRRRIQDIFFLGDAVGYGPEPNEAVGLLKAECKKTIAGNHDWGALGLTDTRAFNEYARNALFWTRGVLTAESVEVLRAAPLKAEIMKEITLVHATPLGPEKWHYLLTLPDAEINFRYMHTDICFVGHSHRPFIAELSSSGGLTTDKQEMPRKEGSRYIVNTGSIGQPRDGDPRACYAIADEDRIELVRVAYDIKSTQKKMAEAGLPQVLIDRLSYGL
jgi:diadenosine tetraphosphatase ApaH/serine/threonine PP2A family protein phosphatase